MSAARRRKKANDRRQALLDLDVRWAFKLDRLPLYAIAVSICSCGRQAWMMPGAAADDWESWQRDEDDHVAYCDGLDDVGGAA